MASNNPFDLAGRVAVVTGSTKGIGLAIARGMAEAGARVVVSSRKADACEETARDLSAAGHAVLAVPCHVGHKDQLHDLVDRTLEEWGRIDILVCNAAANPLYGPLLQMTDEAYDKTMNTNVRSTMWLCNMVLPGMAESGGGSVILISSIAALRGSLVNAVYGVSKAAELALTRSLALEWGPRNVRVNAIAPGLVKTDFARALWQDPERRDRIERRSPLRRIGEPDDIGGVATFLASDAAAFVTGQVIVADGGETVS